MEGHITSIRRCLSSEDTEASSYQAPMCRLFEHGRHSSTGLDMSGKVSSVGPLVKGGLAFWSKRSSFRVAIHFEAADLPNTLEGCVEWLGE